MRRQVQAKLRLRLSQDQPAGIVGLTAVPGGQVEIERGADPSLRMNMVGVATAAVKPDRPAARKADPAIALRAKQRMSWVRSRQPRYVLLDRRDNRCPQASNRGIGAPQQRPIGLASAAYRLVHVLARTLVERPQPRREVVQRLEFAREVRD